MFPEAGAQGANGGPYNAFACPGVNAPRKPTAAELAQPRAQREAAVAGAVLNRINLARARAGLQPVSVDATLRTDAGLVATRTLAGSADAFQGINMVKKYAAVQWFGLGSGSDVESPTAPVIVANNMAKSGTRPAIMSPNAKVVGISVKADSTTGQIVAAIISGESSQPAMTNEQCSFPTPGQTNPDGSLFEPVNCGTGLVTPSAADEAKPMNERLAAASKAITDQMNAARSHEGVPTLPTADDLNTFARNYAYAIANGTTKPQTLPFTQVYAFIMNTGQSNSGPESVPAYMTVAKGLMEPSFRSALLLSSAKAIGAGVAVSGDKVVTAMVVRKGAPGWPENTLNPEVCGTNADGSSRYTSQKCGGQVRILNTDDAKLSNEAQSAQFTAQFLPYVNQARAVQGLPPVTRTSEMDAFAKGWLSNPAKPVAPAGWDSNDKHGMNLQMIQAGPSTPTGVLSLNPAATIAYIPRMSDMWKTLLDPAATEIGLAATHTKNNNYVYLSATSGR